MGNTVNVSIGNKGKVIPMQGESGNTSVSVGTAEEEPSCFDKLGFWFCGG